MENHPVTRNRDTTEACGIVILTAQMNSYFPISPLAAVPQSIWISRIARMLAVTAALAVPAFAKELPRITDGLGREILPGGFVVLENVPYQREDYQRMVRMGANFQVIRMPVGKIGGWPGTVADPRTLAHFDELVKFGKEAGMKTIFKMVFYGVEPRGEKQWEMVWSDTDGTCDQLLRGWKSIWERYKNEESVFGYDLLNEPTRGEDPGYEAIQRDRMLPLLRRMTDEMREISPEKWVLWQPLLRKPEDQKTRHRDPVVVMDEPFGRERAIYAPHLYQMDPELVGPMLDSFERQAAVSDAPLLLGEWGSPVYSDTDGDPRQQAQYTKVYRHTVNELDGRGVGGIKAWFCGRRKPIPVDGPRKWMTWSLFSDQSAVGRVERSYLFDGMVRPRPLVVAGRLGESGNDFAKRAFRMTLDTDPTAGATEIFVPAERWYPEGFELEVGGGLTLILDPGSSGFRRHHAASAVDRGQAELIRWDETNQRVVVLTWKGPARKLAIEVRPRESPNSGAINPNNES